VKVGKLAWKWSLVAKNNQNQSKEMMQGIKERQ
jgi:hypothetical protein